MKRKEFFINASFRDLPVWGVIVSKNDEAYRNGYHPLKNKKVYYFVLQQIFHTKIALPILGEIESYLELRS